MKTNDRELKRAFREYIQSDSGTCKIGCPPAEEIWGLFVGKSSVKRKARMVDHITSCSSCFREFDALLEISRAEGKLISEVQLQFRNRPSRAPYPWVWRYVTAFLVLIVVLTAAVLTTRWLGLTKKPEERGRLSGQLRLLAPGQKAPLRRPLLFRWEGIAGAECYIIEIFDDTLLSIWKSPRLTGTSYELPMSVIERMERRKNYFWMLTALSRDGTRTESSLEEFRLID